MVSLAPREANDRPVAPKSNVVHQAAHQKYPKAAAALVGLYVASNRRRGEPRTAIVDLDPKLLAVETAIHGEAGGRRPAPVLDGVAQRFTGCQPNIRDLAFGEAASARKPCHAAPGQSHVPDIARVVGTIMSFQCCSRTYEFPGRGARLNLPQQPGPLVK